jgi:hypothetical protein
MVKQDLYYLKKLKPNAVDLPPCSLQLSKKAIFYVTLITWMRFHFFMLLHLNLILLERCAIRSNHLKVLFIRKAKAPHCFQGRTPTQLNLKYYNNAKAWMTYDIFCSWIYEWNTNLQLIGCKIILFVDNLKGHNIDGLHLTHIRLEFFATNLIEHVQPSLEGNPLHIDTN